MAQLSITTTKSVARCALHGLGYLSAYLAFGTLTSVVAATCGTILVCLVGMGWSGIAAVVFNPAIPIVGLPIGFLLSMPVTFFVLPALSLFLQHRPATHLFALSVSGAATGGWITSLWVDYASKFSGIATELIVAGAAAGLISGMAYAAMVRCARN